MKKKFYVNFDNLDDRCLMATGLTAGIYKGILTVRGTEVSDVINVQVHGRRTTVDEIPRTFRTANIRQIRIVGGDGNDTINFNINPKIKRVIPIKIESGSGNDIINGVFDFQPIPTPTPIILPVVPATLPTNLIEQRIIELTNNARRSANLETLVENEALMRAARIHANNMAKFDITAHEIPGADFPTLRSRGEFVGYKYARLGENIAYNFVDAEAVVAAWLESSGHRDNLLFPGSRDIGVGVAFNEKGEPYYCQVFGQPL